MPAMPAFKLNLAIDQGATFLKTVTWSTGPKRSPVPVDLTDCSARMQVREKLTSTETLLELTTGNGGITLGETDGKITLRIEADETAAFTWNTGVYDLEISFPTSPEPTVRRLLSGTVSVSPEVTR